MSISLKELTKAAKKENFEIVWIPENTKKEENIKCINIKKGNDVVAKINMKRSWDIKIQSPVVKPIIELLNEFAQEEVDQRFGVYEVEIEVTAYDAYIMSIMKKISENDKQQLNWNKEEIYAMHHLQRQLNNAKLKEI